MTRYPHTNLSATRVSNVTVYTVVCATPRVFLITDYLFEISRAAVYGVFLLYQLIIKKILV